MKFKSSTDQSSPDSINAWGKSPCGGLVCSGVETIGTWPVLICGAVGAIELDMPERYEMPADLVNGKTLAKV